MRNLLWLLVLSAFVSMSGCSSPSATVTDGAGNKVTTSADGTKVSVTDASGKTSTMEADKDGKGMTIKADDGTSTVEAGKGVSEADLGIAFYPGSAEKEGGSFKADTPDEKDVVSSRTTTDEPAKVIEFYKPKVKEASTMSTGADGTDSQMLTGKLESGDLVTVVVMREKGKTETSISVSTKHVKKK